MTKETKKLTFDTIRVSKKMKDKFDDLSNEESRTYQFPGNELVTIEEPIALNVSRSGGHRIIDADGHSHYIPKGWIRLKWIPRDGANHLDF